MPGNRRDVLGLGFGLGAGLLALTPEARAERRDAVSSAVQSDYPLSFRIEPGYRPSLSSRSGRRLARAMLGFMKDSHPAGMTMSLWERNPRDMPNLPAHLERVVAGVFEGIKANRDTWPVDPGLVLALLYNESRFKPTVISPAGAVGMAQFMPDTARELGLVPLARDDLWEKLREVRRQEREARAQRVEAFRTRFGVDQFAASAAIDKAIATGAVDVLREFVAINAPSTGVEKARQDYVAGVAEALAAQDILAEGGVDALAPIDARASYQALPQAVTYIARRLRDTDGMVSSAVAAYNAGPESVRVENPRSVLYRFGEVPAYAETVMYVQRILAVYSEIKLRLAD